MQKEFSNPLKMKEIANLVLDSFSKSQSTVKGSFANKHLNKEGDFDPIISLIEYPQYHLLISADAIKHIASSMINHRNSTTKEPLPLFAFYVLARTVIESCAIVSWLLKFENEEGARQKAIQIMNRNFSSVQKYFEFRLLLEPSHINSVDRTELDVLKSKTQAYAEIHNLKYERIPEFLTRDGKAGILAEIANPALELLYIQLSSVVHANSWSFSLNAKKTHIEGDIDDISKTVQYGFDENLLDQVLSMATLMLFNSYAEYRQLFDKRMD